MSDVRFPPPSESISEDITDLVRAFDEAWRDGRPRDIEDVVREANQAGDGWELRRQLIHVELEWRLKKPDSTPARVEEYLSRYPELNGPLLVLEVWELIQLEIATRRRREPELTLTEYVERFPRYQERLQRLFSRYQGAVTPVVPGYDILAQLGQGGIGTVYQARDRDLNRLVALKVLSPRPGLSADPTRLVGEAQAMAQLDHPNVVRVYEVGNCDLGAFFTMELVDGGTLQDLIQEGPMLVDVAAALLLSIARGVEAAHQHKLIHMDLKPGNVLLTPDGVPKVADFGMARLVCGEDSVTETTTLRGTPSYMAPEQAAEGAKAVSARTDVYALGAILYACLTGRPPFQGGSPLETLVQVRTGRMVRVRDLRPDVPIDLETICEQALRPVPGHRYPTAAALAADLERYLQDLPVSARPVNPLMRLVKWTRRNPLAGMLIVALLLALLGGLFAAHQHQRAIVADNQRLREEHRLTLKLALQKGNLLDAVAAYRLARDEGLDVTPEMRLDYIESLIALAQSDQAKLELAAFKETDVPPGLRSRGLFLEGNFLLGKETQRGCDLILQALAEGDLPPADQHYGRAILAGLKQTSADALKECQQAIDQDPKHLGARTTGVLLLYTLGRLDEAVVWAEFTAALYPQHPDALTMLALAQAAKGKTPEARVALNRLQPTLPPEQYQTFQKVVEHIPQLQRTFFAGLHGEPIPPNPLFPGSDTAPPFSALLKGWLPTTALKAQTLIWQIMRMGNLDRLAQDDALFRELEQTQRSHQEGALMTTYATALMIRANAGVDKEGISGANGDRYRDRLTAAAQAYHHASKLPTVIDVRELSLDGAIHCYTLAGKPLWSPVARPEAVQSARKCLEERLLLKVPLSLGRIELMVKTARNAGAITLARRVLDDWETRAAGDLRAAKLRAEIEFQAEAHSTALRAARLVLAKEPTHPQMLAIQKACLAKLRE